MDNKIEAIKTGGMEAFRIKCIELLNKRLAEAKKEEEDKNQSQYEAELKQRREYNLMPHYTQNQPNLLNN